MEKSNKSPSFWERFGAIIVGVGFVGGAVFLVVFESIGK